MAEPANVGRPVGPLPVTDGDLDNLQILLRRTEEQIEIPEGIEVTEIGPILGNAFIVAAMQHLRAAERVFDCLP